MPRFFLKKSKKNRPGTGGKSKGRRAGAGGEPLAPSGLTIMEQQILVKSIWVISFINHSLGFDFCSLGMVCCQEGFHAPFVSQFVISLTI